MPNHTADQATTTASEPATPSTSRPDATQTKAIGVRTSYDSMPAAVRRWIERVLGSQVVQATDQQGGMSPGIAARLVCASGRRAFVKAVGSPVNPDSPGIYRKECAVVEHLPDIDLLPRVYATYDDGTWVGLLLEDIDGRQPDHPWTEADVNTVFPAIGDLTEALTPSPWPAAPRVEVCQDLFLAGWKELQAEDARDLDPWALEHLDELVAYAERAASAVQGGSLANWDIRADNILITDAGRVVFVDWSWGCLAAPWADTALACLDLPLSRSPVDPDRLLATHRLTSDVDPEDITALVASIAGALTAASRRPVPPGLPTIRSFQRLSAAAFLGWTRRRIAGP